MSRRKKDPRRPLTELERQELARISRSQAAPAVQVARATMLLAVSRGDPEGMVVSCRKDLAAP